jgi:hypothetical protein
MAKILAVKKSTQKPTPYKHDVSDCITKIIKNAKKHDKTIEYIDFELSSLQRFGAKPMRYKTGQSIKIYRKTKTGKEKATKTFVSHNFCPFCGKEF